MPIISTLGAASSRGFGEFNNIDQANYIENYFQTFLYNGDGESDRLLSTSVILEGTASWASFATADIDSIQDVTVDSSGYIYVTGYTGSPVNTLVTAKFDSNGTVIWQRYLSNTDDCIGQQIYVDSSGNVYVSGLDRTTTECGLIIKYNSSGVLQWQSKLTITGSDQVRQLNGIAVNSSGDVYVAGWLSGTTTSQGIVAKFNSSGILQWRRYFADTDIDANLQGRAYDVALDTSGNVYVVGAAPGSGGINNSMLLKYDSTGAVQWSRRHYLNSVNNPCLWYGIHIDASNNIFVLGQFARTSPSSRTAATYAKFDTSGNLQSSIFLDGGMTNSGVQITSDSDGNIYTLIDQSTYMLICKHNSSNILQWTRRVLFYGATITPYGISLSGNGDLYICGDKATTDGFAIKIKADGSTTSGSAYIQMFAEDSIASSSVTLTLSSDPFTEASGSGSASGTATDAAGTAAITVYNQPNVQSNGGLFWAKSRSSTAPNVLYDTARGAKNQIISNSTAGQTSESTGLTAFAANGINIGSLTALNNPTQIYANWLFKKKSKFFDIVTYTGTGANRTISHSLGSVPGMIIVKRTDTSAAWAVYHRSLANTEYLVLNTFAPKATGATYWNSTTPTASEFSLGTSTDINANGGTYVAYLFAHNAGGFGLSGTDNVIQCGSYTGNGLAAGPEITLGWEPQYIFIKSIDTLTAAANGNWWTFDNTRGNSLDRGMRIAFSVSDAESNAPTLATFKSTGFQLTTSGETVNGSGKNYVYMAIRRGPMKVPTDGTQVFMPTVYTGTNVDNRLVNTTIAPDMVWVRQRNDTVLNGMVVGDRVRGQPYLLTGTTAQEVNDADSFDTQILSTVEYGTAFSSMNGFYCGNDATSKLNVSTVASNQIAEAFKRAPGFFDIVCYTGTGAAQTINHNLTVVPELIIVKRRNVGTAAFSIYNQSTGASRYLEFSTADGATDDNFANYWNNTAPTSTVFSVKSAAATNISGTSYVAYLFATCPDISKVGNYTGTGTTQQINCGFSSGARFVLIKRTDSTGYWYVYDTARGIVAGNDPYILLDSTAAEVTNTDYVDTYSAGFELSSTAPAGLNEAPGITWVSRTSGFGTDNIFSIKYGNGLYVAAGANGTLTTSTDTFTWTSRTSQFGADSIRDVVFGSNLFVAVGGSGKISTSTDGITWTARTSGTTTSFNGVSYGNGIYVAVGASGILYTSPDGITWTSRTSGFGTTTIEKVAYGNGLFVIVGRSGTLSTSTDGITWTSRTSGFSTSDINTVTFGNGIFVIGGGSGLLSTSTDGVTWTSRTSGFGTTNIQSSAYGNGLYFVVGDSGKLSTSTDSITWTSRTSGFGTTVISAAGYGDGFYLAGGTSATMTGNKPSYIYLAIA